MPPPVARLPSARRHPGILPALATLALLAACRPGPSTVDAAGLEACRLPGIEREVRCGTVQVPENPDTPAGRSIGIRFAVVPAVARNKEPDPVLVLAGGPGQAATRVAGQVMPLFAKLNARRDIVFIDQRGTGGSNALECPLDEASIAASVDVARQLERIRSCLKKLPGDTAQYASWIAVRDFDAVRARLGAPQLNLWGASYGTRAALEYLRQFPTRVRSVVLDGVAPPDMVLPVAFALDTVDALDRLVAACRADTACNARYPELAARIDALWAKADAGFDVTIRHPLTGAKETLRVDRPLLSGLLRGPLYVPQLGAMLPFALGDAANGDFNALVTITLTLGSGVNENFAYGMHLAVVCAEDLPRVSPALRAQAEAARFGATFLDLYTDLCRTVAVRPVPAEFYVVAASPVPVLVLSGGMDPATPPRHGESVAQRLGTARHFVAPHLGHGISGQACAPDLVTRFIRNASFEGLDAGCLERLPVARFFTPIETRPAPGVAR